MDISVGTLNYKIDVMSEVSNLKARSTNTTSTPRVQQVHFEKVAHKVRADRSDMMLDVDKIRKACTRTTCGPEQGSFGPDVSIVTGGG